MFGAVATSWNRYYPPETERTKHLYEFAMNALKTRRQQEQQARLLEKVPVETVTRLPDIALRDMNGDKKALSSLQGKVVLLDFVIYNADFSPNTIWALMLYIHNTDRADLKYIRFRSILMSISGKQQLTTCHGLLSAILNL